MSSLINNSVNLGGNQEISGLKTITNPEEFHIINNDVDTNKTPAENIHRGITIYDKNGVRFGRFENVLRTNGQIGLQFSVSRLIDGALKYAGGLGLLLDAAGNSTTICPSSDVEGSIVTTAAIRKTGNGYLKFGNGIQIVWGSGNTNTTTTFSHPFSTIFSIVCSNVENGNYGYAAYIGTYSNTNVFMRKYNNATVSARYIAIGLGA